MSFHRNLWKRRHLAAACWLLALLSEGQAAPLMEEGFNYPAGTSLAADPPWAGSVGTSVGVVNGNLILTNLAASVPAGNMLQITGGTGRTVYRNFSTNAITGGAVYCSALIRCNLLPTNSQFIASLLPAGSTSHNRDTDPLALNVKFVTGGYKFSLSNAGGDLSTGGPVLTANSTHFIVLKYNFGSSQASMYVDPTPGGVEPSSATITPEQGDSGTGAPNLQVLLFQASSSVGQGIFNLDTVRIGINWSDVTPQPSLVSVTGPQDLAECFGIGAINFNVQATGTPPITYQWRTNGVNVANATNEIYTLINPNGNDALNNYDVVVADAFGSVTSRVAKLSFSTNAAAIVVQPASQFMPLGVSNAIFSVTASGDAPLSFQWRTNGIPIPGATNTSYTLSNPGPADVTNALDVVVANPCGSVTSSPPVGVYFPNIFYIAYDAGAGFFSGENLILTNASGLTYYVWSTPDLSLSVTNWTLEGTMSELPLGITGNSRYGINLNPVTSPVYYVFAETNTGPYTAVEALVWLTTADFVSFTVTGSEIPINTGGIFSFQVPPSIIQSPQSQTVLAGQKASFNVLAAGSGNSYQWFANNSSLFGASAQTLSLSNVSITNSGTYFALVTNILGSVTSSIATLTILSPPALNIVSITSGNLQLNANSATGLTYVVESATNLSNPIWLPVLTNYTGISGVINFQTNSASGASQFYRLAFP